MSVASGSVTVMQDEKRGESSRRQPLRLPVIAPKDDQASSTSSDHSGRTSAPPISTRSRLPPRSRTGCWTCRHRKVKCDETRPVCGQCHRLGHTCDYHPRLSFRDDTQRVVDRMQDVTVVGSAVWERILSPTTSSVGSATDDLPPFASLLTDEERERKAGACSPGTYHVVVGPESFQHLPEYADEPEKKERLSPLRRPSIAASMASSIGRESALEAPAISDDPNVVILPRFEDLSRRSTREVRSPTLPPATGGSRIKIEDLDEFRSSHTNSELESLHYFRNLVWKQLVPAEHQCDNSIVLLDSAANQFPPLTRVMLAVACVAQVQQDGKTQFDALQHYLQVLPELSKCLKSEEDLASDGSFLTHFLMLVYEVAVRDPEHPNVWLQHIEALLKITILRRRFFGAERFPFIVWWIVNIDLDAMLSGVGTGQFVKDMLNHELIPPPSFHLYPLGSDGSSVVYSEERDLLPAVLQLDYEITLLAVRLGFLASEFRQDPDFEAGDAGHKANEIRRRQCRIMEVQDSLRRLWMVSPVCELPRAQMPRRVQRIYEHASALYRACLIYSYTSMWSGQRLDTPPDCESDIATASYQILEIATEAIRKKEYDRRSLVFPLFMAGFASTDGRQKMVAHELIQQLEEHEFGRNTTTTREALELIYGQQNQSFMHTGHSLDVDWQDIMIEHRLTVVNFGL